MKNPVRLKLENKVLPERRPVLTGRRELAHKGKVKVNRFYDDFLLVKSS